MLCVNEYNCFNFNIQTGTCLLYNSCNSSDMTVSESGWRFFTDISLKQEGKYMFDHYLFIIFQYQTENKKCIIIYKHICAWFYPYQSHIHVHFFFFIYPVFIILINLWIFYASIVKLNHMLSKNLLLLIKIGKESNLNVQ